MSESVNDKSLSTADKVPGRGLLHPFPNQQWLLVRGGLPIDLSPWIMDGVLALLQAEFISSGLIKEDIFIAGYGASQAIPGPLFTFSAYLGMFFNSGLSSWLTSFICLFFIFLPSFLLVIGTLPIWEELRKITLVIRSLKAINASVIGLLIAAWFYPIIL
jgi:hypothetical protein